MHFLFGKQLLCLSLVFITMYFWIVSLKTLKVINLLQLWGLSVPQGCNLSQQEDSTSCKVIGFFSPISSPILSYISLSLTEFDYLSVDYCLTVLYSTTSFSLTVSQFRHSIMSNSLWSHELPGHQASLSITNSRSPPNSCPLSWWCHQTISSSVIPFSSCPQSFPASGSFPMSQVFTSGGQSIGVSALASVLPMNTQDWSPLGWTGWISLQSKGLSRVFSNTTVQKHQFFGAQLSSQSNSHIHTWLLEKP